jgi:hypothetical protein
VNFITNKFFFKLIPDPGCPNPDPEWFSLRQNVLDPIGSGSTHWIHVVYLIDTGAPDKLKTYKWTMWLISNSFGWKYRHCSCERRQLLNIGGQINDFVMRNNCVSRYRSPKEQDGEVLSIAADAEVLTTKGEQFFFLFSFGMIRNGRIVGREEFWSAWWIDRWTELFDSPLYSILYLNERVEEETIGLK